jgi:hypothetical protein
VISLGGTRLVFLTPPGTPVVELALWPREAGHPDLAEEMEAYQRRVAADLAEGKTWTIGIRVGFHRRGTQTVDALGRTVRITWDDGVVFEGRDAWARAEAAGYLNTKRRSG